jgi:hypothetical protein
MKIFPGHDDRYAPPGSSISENSNQIEVKIEMKCPECNNEIPDNFKFCNHCGAKIKNLGKSCPNKACNFTGLPLEALYCPDCGTKLNDEFASFKETTGINVEICDSQRDSINRLEIDKSHEKQIRFVMTPIKRLGLSKKSFFTVYVDNIPIKKGLLVDGFEFMYTKQEKTEGFYLVEIRLSLYDSVFGMKTTEIKEFTQRINLTNFQNNQIEFIYTENPLQLYRGAIKLSNEAIQLNKL